MGANSFHLIELSPETPDLFRGRMAGGFHLELSREAPSAAPEQERRDHTAAELAGTWQLTGLGNSRLCPLKLEHSERFETFDASLGVGCGSDYRQMGIRYWNYLGGEILLLDSTRKVLLRLRPSGANRFEADRDGRTFVIAR